ncbi:hypothetical protein DSY14_26025 [Nocardiopsis sp. MG754419]|nr:hypothetical protein [Nocardiopsis sp. MG754419]
MLGGDFPTPDYGYPPVEDWRPGGDQQGGRPRHGRPAPRPGPGPYGEEPPSGYGQEYYEGGYEDGRFH